MRRDMTDLKKLVLDLAAGQRPHEAQELLRQNSHLFGGLSPYEAGPAAGRPLRQPSPDGGATEYILTPRPTDLDLDDTAEYEEEVARVEDIPHETEEETLSLEAKEKEMIIKALKKHNNKRKYAAHDLGISERTLYRKLKQYDLENA